MELYAHFPIRLPWRCDYTNTGVTWHLTLLYQWSKPSLCVICKVILNVCLKVNRLIPAIFHPKADVTRGSGPQTARSQVSGRNAAVTLFLCLTTLHDIRVYVGVNNCLRQGLGGNEWSPSLLYCFIHRERNSSRVQLKCNGTRWCTGGKVKGKLANGMGSQHSSHHLGTWCIQHYYRWCAHLGCQQSTELTPPADLNGLVPFAERRDLVCARVPSHFKRSLPLTRRTGGLPNRSGRSGLASASNRTPSPWSTSLYLVIHTVLSWFWT